jgi:HlyD family secretion protein
VKKGDLLVTVDKKPYEDSRVTAVDDLQTARQSLVITQQAVPIAESKAESGVATARTQRDEAALALKLYTTIEVPKKLNEFETQSNDVRSKLQDAQKSLTANQSQLDEHLEDDDQKKSFQQQVDLSKQTISSFQKTINTLDAQRKLFRAYTYPQDLKSKKQALANAELQVKTAEISGKSDVLAKKAEVDKAANRISQLQNQIKRFDDQIAKCSVYSPADGLVYYGSPDMNRYGYTADQVRVGVDWYQNAPIMTIPDLSSFKVDVGIPEVYRGRLAVGQPARVSLEAIPDLVLTGNLETLTSVARSRVQWDPSSPQVFDASITLHQTDPRMVAGMSALVQITTATYENALYVPIEGVFSDEGRTVVYLHRTGAVPEKVPVKTGDANDHFVLIAAGPNPGDQILLSRPDTFFTPPDFLDRLQAVNDVAPPMPVVPPLRATPDAPTSEAAPTTSAAATAPAAAVTRPSTAPATAPTTTTSEGQNHGSGADSH